MNDALRTALNDFKPQIAADFTRYVERTFARMVERHGPTLAGVYNSNDARAFRTVVAEFIRHAPTTERTARPEKVLDAEALAVGATRYADEVVKAWAGKIARKMGELEDAHVGRMGDVAFRITGRRGGKDVCIEQQMIFAVSHLGTPYNQFPARLYVNTKFTSEAAYKRMFA